MLPILDIPWYCPICICYCSLYSSSYYCYSAWVAGSICCPTSTAVQWHWSAVFIDDDTEYHTEHRDENKTCSACRWWVNERLKECESEKEWEWESVRVTFEHRQEKKSCSACQEWPKTEWLKLDWQSFMIVCDYLWSDMIDRVLLVSTCCVVMSNHRQLSCICTKL